MRSGAQRSRRGRKHRHVDNCHGAETEDALVLLMFGVSSLGTVSVEEIGSTISTPKLFQLYFHKAEG